MTKSVPENGRMDSVACLALNANKSFWSESRAQAFKIHSASHTEAVRAPLKYCAAFCERQDLKIAHVNLNSVF